MNLSELRIRVDERLDEDSVSPLRWPAATIDGFINEGIRLMAVRSGGLIGTTVLEAVSGVTRYELPADCVQVVGVSRQSPREMVEPVHVRELDEAKPAWQTLTSDRFQWYFIFGVNQITLLPASTSDGEPYDVVYRKDPGDTSLMIDTDEPAIPRRFHEGLVDYAIGRALLMEADEGRMASAAEAMGRFAADTARLRRVVHRAPDRMYVMRGEDYSGGWIE